MPKNSDDMENDIVKGMQLFMATGCLGGIIIVLALIVRLVW